jgi:hypothetical protein
MCLTDIEWIPAAQYPTGRIHSLFRPEVFARLVETYPSEASFGSQAGTGYDRLWLNQRAHPEPFETAMAAAPEWAQLRDYIRSPQFLAEIHAAIPATRAARSAYFEFHSMETGCGAAIARHTDLSVKVASLIVWMLPPGAWDPTWGGGTDVLRSGAGEIVHTFDYAENAATLLVKTDQSWHAVRPIGGPRGYRRRTIDVILGTAPPSEDG